LRVDGDFEGNVRTDGRVLVGKSGRARCLIEADTVVIGGIVKGDVKAATKVVLLSTCVMIGNINSPQLIVEEGVLLHGHATVTDDEKALKAAPAGDEGGFSVDFSKAKAEMAASSPGL
jgi:cytoskeletal protein CcmA (bactofilin family)